MSFNSDGTVTCDRDGVDVGNGGVQFALVVSDLDPDNVGHVRNFHFCRDREDEDGKKVTGCASKVLSARNLEKFLNDKKEAESDGTGAQ